MKKYWLVWGCIIFFGCEEEAQRRSCNCSNSYSEYVDPNSDSLNVFIPNSFTPNGDGINDLFYIHGQNISQISIQVKDGSNVVFSSNSQNIGWDGTVNGNLLAACQNFDYVVDVTFVNGTTKHYQNTITAIYGYPYNPCPGNASKCVFGNGYDGVRLNGNLPWGEDFTNC